MKKTSTQLAHPMALPSRLALWVGVGFFVAAFSFYHIFLAVIGCVFLIGGVFLWLRYHPHPWAVPFSSAFFKSLLRKKPNADKLQDLAVQGKEALRRLEEAKKSLSNDK